MTDHDRQQIIDLRHKGYKLTEIAEIIHVNVSTIKTFCRKSGLSAPREKEAAVEQFNKGCCPQCGKKIDKNTGFKPRRFCSPECRKTWWKHNSDHLNKKAVYFFTCPNCGKAFSAYGNAKRKYCSVRCYRSARFEEGSTK